MLGAMSRHASTKKTDHLEDSGPFGLVVLSVGAPFGTTLDEGVPLDIGRDAGLSIEHESVSRRHARIEWDGPNPVVRDLESTNGTKVDGRRLVSGERAPIAIGSTLLLGRIAVLVQPVKVVRDLVMGRAGAKQTSDELPGGVIARDPKMRELYGLVQVIAPSDLPILVLGETGCGKEVLASAIHRLSARAEKACLALSCASLPENLLESELFGYERGAFTGAQQAKAGLFEAADGGTLFLDEIGETTLPTQAKLLRILETGELLRLGSLKPRTVDVRIVAATNRNLEARVAEGAFRSDLYYRLAGMVLTIPALRERPGDIEALAKHFVVHFAAKAGRPPAAIGPRALAALEAHGWPGNARELRNVIQRASVLAGTSPTIEPEHLALGSSPLDHARRVGQRVSVPASAPTPSAPAVPSSGDLRKTVDQFERDRIVEALKQCDGNQTKAAELLGVARRTLVAKIEQHGIDRPRKR
jgi:transcriptional regulator with GAF, ATPase, and Fis domain